MDNKVEKAMDNLAAPQGDVREKILAFEDVLSKHKGAFFGDTPNCPLTHRFADGIYTREIFIPAGTHIVGKIHKLSHPIFLMSGTVDVVSESGGYVQLTGPMTMITPAGTKRAFRAITDVVWVTVHPNPTNTQDLDVIEKNVIAESYEEFQKFVDNKESAILNP